MLERSFQEPRQKPLDGMYLPMEKAEMVLKLLLEGNSVSSVERITEVHHTHDPETAGAGWREVRAHHGREDPQCPGTRRGVRRTLVVSSARSKSASAPKTIRTWRLLHLRRHRAALKLVLNIALGKRDQATTDVFIEGVRHATSRGAIPDHDGRLRAVPLRDHHHAA